MRKGSSILLLACMPSWFSHAEIKAQVTYDRGVSAEVVNPAARDGALILPQGALSFARISRMDFDPGSDFTLQKCEELFKKGEFDSLNKALSAVMKQVAPFADLPGNLDGFLVWQMKVQFWSGQYDGMKATAEILSRRKSPAADLSALYDVLVQIEQGQPGQARDTFKAMGRPEEVSAPMTLFVQARLAMADRNYREALQNLGRMVALHGRDPEWMPAATLYEGLAYKRTGYLEAAGNIFKELTERYPGGYWSRRAEELK